jgi:DNA-directed RNA polymerase subunit L
VSTLKFLRDNDVEISGYDMDHEVIEDFWESLELATKRLENLP